MPSIPERTLPVGTVTFLFTDIEGLDDFFPRLVIDILPCSLRTTGSSVIRSPGTVGSS